MQHAAVPTSAPGRWLAACDRVPPLAWLGMQAAALWPHWRWAAARLADGSDDPLGVAALAVLGLALWRLAPRLRSAPSRAWLVVAMLGTLLGTLLVTLIATLAAVFAPPLLAACVAMLALVAGLCAFAPSGTPLLPLAGLSVLALPVVSSLQYYAGFPLRVLTAQLSTWSLQAMSVAAERSGTAMLVEGRLVIVDAPCSGVQMVWMAYFCACTVAWYCGITNRHFLKRLAFVGAIVLAGNVLRNSVLVVLEARQANVPALWHEAIGLVALALVCAAVARVVHGGRNAHR
jgi:exosortase/archaeosortase family protein